MVKDERIERALAIEQRDFAALDEKLAREANRQSLQTRAAYATKGAGTSSMLIVALMDLQISRLRAIVRAACERRRSMCQTVSELGSEEQANALQDRLRSWLDLQWGALPTQVSAYLGYEGFVGAEILQAVDASDALIGLKNEITRELDNLKDEVKLGMHQQRAAGSSITVHITGGTVGGINLAPIAGDMNVAITAVHGAGGEPLAQAIKRVTEAVAVETSLSPEKRAEVIETLTAITQEAALPPERRKWHLVRSLAAQAGSIVLKLPQLVEAWNTLQAQLTTWFGRNPPGL